METMKYTCAQSFISMCIIVGKFEKWRSDIKENCLRLSVVGGCHGNQFIAVVAFSALPGLLGFGINYTRVLHTSIGYL